jgi:hypothetical protein
LLNEISHIEDGHSIAILREGLEVEVDGMCEVEISHASFHHQVVNFLVLKVALDGHVGDDLGNLELEVNAFGELV